MCQYLGFANVLLKRASFKRLASVILLIKRLFLKVLLVEDVVGSCRASNSADASIRWLAMLVVGVAKALALLV